MTAPVDSILSDLQRSEFRRRFRLRAAEWRYLDAKGVAVVLRHAADFIERRLAPAAPLNDGKQTPLRGHPVFVAQHATATCCRRCLARWHKIPAGRPLSAEEQDYVVAVIRRWLEQQDRPRADPGTAQLTMEL